MRYDNGHVRSKSVSVNTDARRIPLLKLSVSCAALSMDARQMEDTYATTSDIKGNQQAAT